MSFNQHEPELSTPVKEKSTSPAQKLFTTLLDSLPTRPSKRTFSSVASASPDNSDISKSLRFKSPPIKSKMTTEDVTVLKDEVGTVKHQVTGMQDVLNKILEQGNAASADRAKFQTSIERMEKETKALVAENARGLKEFKEKQSEQTQVFDPRLSGLDATVTMLVDKLKSANLGSLEGQPRDYNHEVAHECKLLASIKESNSCVTMLGAKDPNMDVEKLLTAMNGCSIKSPRAGKESFRSISRLGAATSTDPPYKIVMDSEASAESLIEQSRERARLHRATNSSTPPTGIRFVKNYPQEYAQASKDFRSMQAQVYDRGGLAAIEYEGTTLTLKAKSRLPGGQWIIMRGCEYRPAAVGRAVPQDNELECTVQARALVDQVLDNRPNSPLAKSLFLHTKTTLGTIDLAKTKLGSVLSAGLTSIKKVEQARANGDKLVYACTYITREAALTALQQSRNLAKLTDSNMADGEDWFTLAITVVGR